LADGKIVYSSGIGDGIFKGVNEQGKAVSLLFRDVLFVPGLQGNLISVRCLAKKGFHVDFDLNGCSVIRENSIVVIGEVNSSELYQLKKFESL
jgi:hypothetical protein